MKNTYEKDGAKVEVLGWDKDGIKIEIKISTETDEIIALKSPDFEEMSLEELVEFRSRVINKIDNMEHNKPDVDSDEYDDWKDTYYELEEMLVDVEELIENKKQ